MKHASTSPTIRSGVLNVTALSGPVLRQSSNARIPTEYAVSGNNPSMVKLWEVPASPIMMVTWGSRDVGSAKFSLVIVSEPTR